MVAVSCCLMDNTCPCWMLNANNDKNDNSYPEVLVSSVSLLGPSEVLSVLTVSSMAMSLAELAIQVGDTATLFSLSLTSK